MPIDARRNLDRFLAAPESIEFDRLLSAEEAKKEALRIAREQNQDDKDKP